MSRAFSAALVVGLPIATVAGFHDPFTSGKWLILLLLGLPVFLGAWIHQFRRDATDALTPYRLLFLMLVSFGCLVSVVKSGGSFSQLVPFLVMTALPILFLEVGRHVSRSEHGPELLIRWLLYSAIGVLLIGVARRYGGETFAFLADWIPDRADVAFSSTLGNSNELGEFAAPLVAIGLIYALWRKTIFAALLILAPLALLVLSESRGSLLAVVGALAISVIVALLSAKRSPTARRFSMIGLGALLIVALAILIPSSMRERLGTVLDPEHPTNQVRIGLYDAAWKLGLEEFPLGTGGGRFIAEAPRHRSPQEWWISGTNSLIDDPHNEALWAWAETGVLGLLLLLMGLVLVSRDVRRGLAADDTVTRYLALGAGGAIAVMALNALVRSPLHHPSASMVAFLLIGALAGRTRTHATHRLPMVLSGVLVLLTCLGMAIGLWQDRQLFVVRQSKVRVHDALLSPKPDLPQVMRSLEESTEALKSLLACPLLDAQRSYRAAQAGGDLVTARAALEKTVPNLSEMQGSGSSEDWLPTVQDIHALLDNTLKTQPWHAHAARDKAMLILQHSAADVSPTDRQNKAIAVLKQVHDRLTYAVPLNTTLAGILLAKGNGEEAQRVLNSFAGPREAVAGTESLLGECALFLGTTPSSFGTYLDHDRTQPSTNAQRPHIQRANAALRSEDFRTSRHHALVQLADFPCDLEALQILADCGFRQRDSSTWELDLANKAIARQRLLIALEEPLSGPSAHRRLDIVTRKDPQLMDAWFLKAHAAALDDMEDKVQEAVSKLLALGLPTDALRRRMLEESALTPFVHLIPSDA